MFGYLRPFKPEMKMKEFAVYKSIYCGLCRTLGKNYGFASRMILSYDATILSILFLSLREGKVCVSKCFCPANPIRKCSATEPDEIIDFFADVSVILSYYKIRDNINDGKLFKKIKNIMLLPFLKPSFRKAAKKNEFAVAKAKEYIENQEKLEKEYCTSVDKAADPTAALLSSLLVHFSQNEQQKRILERLGYFIGRFIYLSDAAEDIEKDRINNNYNPFIKSEIPDGETEKEFSEKLLNSCIFEIQTSFSLLEVKNFKPILENVFYLGLPEIEKAVLSGLSKKEKREKFSSVYKL